MLFSSVIYYYIKVHFHFYIPRKSYTQYVIFYTHNVFILIPKTVLYPGPMFYIPKKNISPPTVNSSVTLVLVDVAVPVRVGSLTSTGQF